MNAEEALALHLLNEALPRAQVHGRALELAQRAGSYDADIVALGRGLYYETRGTTRDLKGGDPRTKVENVITVSRDDKAGVKFTAKETPALQGKDAASEPPARPPLAMVIAGMAAALAIGTLGVWCFRRK